MFDSNAISWQNDATSILLSLETAQNSKFSKNHLIVKIERLLFGKFQKASKNAARPLSPYESIQSPRTKEVQRPPTASPIGRTDTTKGAPMRKYSAPSPSTKGQQLKPPRNQGLTQSSIRFVCLLVILKILLYLSVCLYVVCVS